MLLNWNKQLSAYNLRITINSLTSKLQTLRTHIEQATQPDPGFIKQIFEIDAPLANRLGIWRLKWELEDLAFRFANTNEYYKITKYLDEKLIERHAFIKTSMANLRAILAIANIKAEVSGRAKHIYSIWKKMHNKALNFQQLYDVHALRIVVPNIYDCYAALNVVHNLWQPMLEKFDDYIMKPKANGYRSLHSIVADNFGYTLEVQIRSQEMHKFAQYGIAAHWHYKEITTRGTGT